jgi:hypothetical protein
MGTAMSTTAQYDKLKDQRAAIMASVIDSLSPETLSDPKLPEIVARLVDQRLGPPSAGGAAPPADGGLADLVGLGGSAPTDPWQYPDLARSGQLRRHGDQ